MKSILDRSFRYTPSHDTDLRKTFARIREEQRLAAETRKAQDAQDEAERARVVSPLRRREINE
jgi:hypothetical protein